MTGNLSTKNREGFQETRRKSSGRQSCSRPKALVAEEAQKTWTESVVIMRKMATAEYLKYKEGFFHMAIAGIPGSSKSSLIYACHGRETLHSSQGSASSSCH